MIINAVMVKKSGAPVYPMDGDYRVRFYDYDGTLLCEQWIDHGQDAIVPTLPTHAGLTFQGWNRAVANITSHRDIGAMYIPTDGKTHAFIRVNAITGLTAVMTVFKSDSSTLTMDWGDGSSDAITSTGASTTVHAYAVTGDYDITLSITSGSGTFKCGTGVAGTTFCGAGVQVRRDMLLELWLGNGCTGFADHGCRYTNDLRAVSLHQGITDLPLACFSNGVGLGTVIVPTGATTAGQFMVSNMVGLRWLILPGGSFDLTATSTALNGSGIVSICFPPNITTIPDSCLSGCVGLMEIIMESTTPPTLANVNAFTGITANTGIYVPDASVDAYRAATNWVTYANYIRPFSELA